MKTCEGLKHYQAALSELASALREGRSMADVLAFFAGQLRGRPQDFDGPPLAAIPSGNAVLRTLRRIDGAKGNVEREWHRLSDEAREGLPSPDALDDDDGEG